jgi:hypothetical protein
MIYECEMKRILPTKLHPLGKVEEKEYQTGKGKMNQVEPKHRDP